MILIIITDIHGYEIQSVSVSMVAKHGFAGAVVSPQHPNEGSEARAKAPVAELLLTSPVQWAKVS